MALNSHGYTKSGDTQMKFTKLLVGAAAAALLSGAASAQVSFYVSQGQTGAPDLSGVPLATGDVWFATEVGSLAGITVPLEFELEPFDAGPATEVFASTANVEGLLTVTVTNAVLDRSLSGADMIGSGACAGQAFSVDANGVAGQSTVTFRIPDLQVCDGQGAAIGGDNAGFAFPILLSGGDVDVSFELRRASNNDLIGSGSWSDNRNNDTFQDAYVSGLSGGPLISQAPAVTATFANGTAIATSASGFNALAPATAGSVTIASTVAPTAVFTADLTPFAAGDLVDVITTCTFASATGLDATGHAIGAVGPVVGTLATTNPVSFDIIGTLDGGAQVLTINPDASATTRILPQAISCSGIYDFTTASGLTDSTFSGAIGSIRRDGVTTGVFEWVGDNSQSTNNVFRITGLPAAGAGASVIITNSNTTGANGEYQLPTLAPTNGEAIIDSLALTNAAGAFGRANVQFSIQVDPATPPNGDILVRRFLVGTNGTLTDFGNENDDGANNPGLPTIPAAGSSGGGSN
jgi:hypothetical protein